jgi:tellurite resistance protein
MIIDTFEQPLKELGLTPRNYQALRVLPLIHVAWADGEVTDEERQHVLGFARTKLGLESEAMQLIHRWLEQPPSKDCIRNGVRLLRRAAKAVDEVDFGNDELLSTLWEAETLTRRAARLAGAPYEPSLENQMALLELAEVLGVDSGTPWVRLLRDLGGDEEVAETLGGPVEETTQTERSSREDRARRWYTALRLHQASESEVPGERGGLV